MNGSTSRWAGGALALAGALIAIGIVVHPPDEFANFTSPRWPLAHWIVVVAAMLALLGIGSVHKRWLSAAGMVGLAGYVLTTIGFAAVVAIATFEAGVVPVLAERAADAESLLADDGPIFTGSLAGMFMTLVAGIGLGGLLSGWSLYQGRQAPKLGALALAAGAPLFTISIFMDLSHLLVQVFGVIFGIGLAWIGYGLWGEAEGATE